MCLAGIAGYFGVGPCCDSVALVSLASPSSLLVMGAFMILQFTLSLSIGTCVHVVWSGLQTTALCLSSDGFSDVLAAYGVSCDSGGSCSSCCAEMASLITVSFQAATWHTTRDGSCCVVQLTGFHRYLRSPMVQTVSLEVPQLQLIFKEVDFPVVAIWLIPVVQRTTKEILQLPITWWSTSLFCSCSSFAPSKNKNVEGCRRPRNRV